MYASPQSYSIDDMTRAMKTGSISSETAKHVAGLQFTLAEKSKDRAWSQAYEGGLNDIRNAFGFSPTFEFTKDPRNLAMAQALREYHDQIGRMNTPIDIQTLRDTIITNHQPQAKIAVEDRIRSLKSSIPTWNIYMSPAENRAHFETQVRTNPAWKNRSHQQIDSYRRNLDQIEGLQTILDQEAAAKHARPAKKNERNVQ
jgi:hypothetical protein